MSNWKMNGPTKRLITVTAIAAMILTGCGSSSSGSGVATNEAYTAGTSDTGGFMTEAATDTDHASEEASEDTSDTSGEGSAADSGSSADPVTTGDTAADIKKKIIYSADIAIDTTNYSAAKDALGALITKYDGFIEASNEYNSGSRYSSSGDQDDRTWYVTVRIPSENFDAFVSDTGTVDGKVTSKSISSSDLTKTYSDNENKLKALETEQESLLSLLEKAESVDDMIAIQSRLTDVRAQIASLTDSNSSIDYQVSYSTVNLTLDEVVLYESRSLSFGERLHNAFGDSWDSFVSCMQIFLIFLVYAVPFLLIIAVVVIIIRKIVKKRKGKKAAARGKAGETDPEKGSKDQPVK